MLERLQKIIARAGIASRRHAEEFITSGLVTVNGQTVTELGSKADASRDHIKVSGKLLRPASASNLVYLILNKPPEVVSTMSDPEGRPSLRDLLHGVSERVFPVGRLEYHSTGLVVLTNDGDLANRILQSNDLRQTYQLKLKTLLTFAEIESLSRATGAHITRLRGKEMPWYEVSLSEARRDALRNKLFQTGHPVDKMRRVGMGNLKLEGLASGRHREVSAAEVATLIRLLDGKETVAVDRPPKRPPKPPKFAKFASLRNPQSSPGPQGPRSRRSPQDPASSRSTSNGAPERSFAPTPRPGGKLHGEQISSNCGWDLSRVAI